MKLVLHEAVQGLSFKLLGISSPCSHFLTIFFKSSSSFDTKFMKIVPLQSRFIFCDLMSAPNWRISDCVQNKRKSKFLSVLSITSGIVL